MSSFVMNPQFMTIANGCEHLLFPYDAQCKICTVGIGRVLDVMTK